MSIETWFIYVVTVLTLMSTPGPSHLLMLSNSSAHGFRKSLATAGGDLTANTLQMLAAGLGLVAIIATSAAVLSIIKWAGVAYLIYLGIRMIRNASKDTGLEQASGGKVSARALWMQGFLTSAANPKAVVFFAALFPQFIQADLAFWPQFLILSATYIFIDGCFLSAYGAAAGWLRERLTGAGQAWVHRIGGGLMIAAAMLLGWKSVSRS